MKNARQWMLVVVILAGLSLAGCAGQSMAASEQAAAPAKLEKVEGSQFGRVTLSQKAAERVGIETAAVQTEQAARTRKVGARVIAPPVAGKGNATDTDMLWVRVALAGSEADGVDRAQPARVLPIGDDGEAQADESIVALPGEWPGATSEKSAAERLYYTFENNDRKFAHGQPVLVELPLKASSKEHLVIPVAALVYGLKGETWVYTAPEALLFVRQPVEVDYIENDMAYLTKGPAAGTAVVTIGNAELLGVELGVGK